MQSEVVYNKGNTRSCIRCATSLRYILFRSCIKLLQKNLEKSRGVHLQHNQYNNFSFMRRILIISAIIAFTSTSFFGFANPTMSDSQICTVGSQSDYKYVKKVNVYIMVNGQFKADGTNEIYKDSRGYLYIKARYGDRLYSVHKTSHPISKTFNSWAVDEWGYYFYFNV